MIPNIPSDIRTPAYVLDVAALKSNLATAARIKRESGAKILLATKAWAMPAAFPMMRDVLDGTTASGEYEARHGARGVRQGGARLRAGLHASRGRKPDRHRRPHLLQLARADRPLPADREAQARRSKSASASIPATRTRRWAARSTTRARPTRASARSRASSTSCRGRTSTSSMCMRCASRCTTARSS